MREIRQSGSEGREARQRAFLTPIYSAIRSTRVGCLLGPHAHLHTPRAQRRLRPFSRVELLVQPIEVKPFRDLHHRIRVLAASHREIQYCMLTHLDKE